MSDLMIYELTEYDVIYDTECPDIHQAILITWNLNSNFFRFLYDRIQLYRDYKVNLSAFVNRLFHEDVSSIDGIQL